MGDYVNIDLVNQDGEYTSTIVSNYHNKDHNYLWTIDSDISANKYYRIKISSTSNPLIYDVSEFFFFFYPRFLRITNPMNHQTWTKGNTHSITWYSENVGGNSVTIDLYKNSIKYKTINSNVQNDGEYIWTIPENLPTSSKYQIMIESNSYSFLRSTSEYFSIIDIERYITISHPKKASLAAVAETCLIQWKSKNVEGSVTIDLYRNNGFLKTLANNIPNDGSYSWIPEISLSSEDRYTIKISNTSGDVEGKSDYFYIQQRYITVLTHFSDIDLDSTSSKQITWESNYIGNTVNIDLYKDGNYYKRIASFIRNNGEYTWDIDTEDSGENYQIRIASCTYQDCFDVSTSFSILAPILSTTSMIQIICLLIILFCLLLIAVIVLKKKQRTPKRIKKATKTDKNKEKDETPDHTKSSDTARDEKYWYKKALKYKEKTEYKNALKYLKKAIEINNFYSEAIKEKNIVNWLLKKQEKIKQLKTKADKQFDQKNFLKAFELYDELLKEENEHHHAKQRIEETFEKLLTTIRSLKRKNQLTDALDLVTSLQKIRPEQKELQQLQKTIQKKIDEQKINELYEKALERENQKDFNTALSYLDKIFEINKNHKKALEEKKKINVKLKNLKSVQSAKKKIKKEKQIDKKNEDYWYNLAIEAEKKKQYEKAIISLEKALEINEFFSEAIIKKNEIKSLIIFEKELNLLIQKADNEFKKGNYEKALISYNKVLNEDKNNAHAKAKKKIIFTKIDAKDKKTHVEEKKTDEAEFDPKKEKLVNYLSKKDKFNQTLNLNDLSKKLHISLDDLKSIISKMFQYYTITQLSNNEVIINKNLAVITLNEKDEVVRYAHDPNLNSILIKNSNVVYDLKKVKVIHPNPKIQELIDNIASYKRKTSIIDEDELTDKPKNKKTLKEKPKMDNWKDEIKQIIDKTEKVEEKKDLPIYKKEPEGSRKEKSSKINKDENKYIPIKTQEAKIKNPKINTILDDLNEKIVQNPLDEKTLMLKAMLLLQHHQYKEALKTLHKLTQLNQNNKKAWYNKGIAYKELKKYKKALLCFDIILQSNPSHQDALEERKTILQMINGNNQ